MTHLFSFFILFTCLISIVSCSKSSKKQDQAHVTFSHSIVAHGTPLTAIIQETEIPFDSVTFTIDNFTTSLPYSQTNSYVIPTKSNTLGKKNITTTIYHANNTSVATNEITVVSDINPSYPSYEVLNSYNHDIDAYTQGLEFSGDSLYESTGIKGESTVRLVEFKKGTVLKKLDLLPEYFGEGLTILNDIIFQITWQSGTGFMYDKSSFRQIGTFNYSTEGWGLCNDGTHLIMSDGSEFLYFYTPESFTLVKQLAVYDNTTAIKQLNELEYVNGYIYANIYTTNFIVKIDASTGKVVERINLSNILDKAYMHDNIDVLNGIAWHTKNNSLFVTGKRWPKMFEIQITDTTLHKKTL